MSEPQSIVQLRQGPSGSGHKPPELTMDNLDLVSDFFCWDSDDEEKFDNAFCFIESATPTPLVDPETRNRSEIGDWLWNLLVHIRQKYPREINFAVHYLDQYVLRVHRENTVLGVQLCIRRVKGDCPRLSDLKFRSRYWVPLLNQPALVDGGIVLYASKPGSGKSTTMAAQLRTRLETFGGFAKTLESPPELPLSRKFGAGICFQCEVDESLPLHEQYPKPFREIALRGFPAIPGGGRTIIMLGEIRDKETAALAVQSSVGHLIMTSIHAENPESACSRLASMAGEILGMSVACDMLASSLRLVISQRLMVNPGSRTQWDRRVIEGDILVSSGYQSRLANLLRSADFAAINNLVRDQATAMARGETEQWKLDDLLAQISPNMKGATR